MADRFWVGGVGTWNTTSTTNWSATSGGGSGASVPTVADSVFFDQAGTYTVTMTGALACLDITVSAGTVTFAQGTAPSLDVRGSMSLLAGTIWNQNGVLTFSATTSGKTITTNGTLLSVSQIVISGVGGVWTLGSALSTSSSISIANGTFDTSASGNYAVTCTQLGFSGTAARTVNLNNSTITCTVNSAFAISVTQINNLTFNSGTSQINLTNTTSGIGSGGLTFYNVAFTSTTVGTKTITGINTFNNFAVTAPSTAGVATVTFDSRQTINGTLSTTGTAGNRRVFFASATYGISYDLVVNSAPSLTDADFRGLYVRGTAAPISGTRIGNRGECRGITFSTPKTVYWNLAGTQNWSANGWATTSTGTPSIDNFPLPQDTATFTNAGAWGLINLDSAIGYVPNVDMSGRTNSASVAFSTANICYGNWTNGSGVTLSGTSTLTFSGGGTQTITSAGKTFTCPITIDTYGGTIQLADALNIGSRTLTVTNGTFTTAGYAVTAAILSSTNSNVRTINLGASTVTTDSNGSFINFALSTNLTFNCGTSTIINSNANSTLAGSGQIFHNVSFTGTAGGFTNTVIGANTFNNLSFSAPSTDLIGLKVFSANQTVNGTLTCAGATAVRRIFLRSDTIGTPRTLTVNAISATDCDFRDINLAGAASGASPTRAGDCGGNTGITFPAPKTVYWNLTGSQQWSATGWASGSGGTPNINNFPLAQDTAVFDNTGSVTGTITINAAWNIGTFDASLRTSAMTLNAASNSPSIYGNWTFGTGVTQSSNPGAINFFRNGTQTITSNGVQFGCPVTINHPSGTVQLADALSLNSARGLTLNAGTFDAVAYNVTAGTFTNGGSTTNILKMGSGTWTLSGTGSVWNTPLGAPITFAGTATIVLSDTSTTARTFAGDGRYYNKLTIGGTTGISTLTITGPNTFGELASTKTVAHTVTFTAGQTTTIGKWAVTGTAGNVVTVQSDLAPIAFTLSIAGPANSGIDYLSVRDCTVATTSPGEFYVGANSTNVSNNTRVIFTATPAARTLYWVGGTGNWSSTARWSTSSGGGSGAAIPTSLDAVNFDAMSNATAYTATIDAGVTLARCASFTMAGPLVGNVTFAGSVGIAFHGNVSFAATGITRTYTGAMNWAGNSSYTFTTNGLSLASFSTVIGIGSTWELGSSLTTGSITTTYGTFSTSASNYNVTSTGAFFSNNLNIRSINLNGSTTSFSGTGTLIVDFTNATNLTFSSGTSQINLSSSVTGVGAGGSLTFNNVSFTSTVASTLTINGANTFNTLSFAGRTSVGIASVTFDSNQTINTLTLNAGTASAYRTFLSSNTIGTTRTLTVGTLTAGAADIDFRDITIAGAAAPISGTRFGDAKGNSGITFDAPKTVFYRQATTSWGLAGTGAWSATSGGAADNTQFPLAQDTAVFPVSPTPYPPSGGTVTINANYNIGTIDMSARTTNTMTLTTGSTTPQIYGNWINGTGTTLSGTAAMTFAGRTPQQITSAGKTFTQGITINSLSGSVTLQDAFISSSNSSNAIVLTAGEFNLNNYNLSLTAAGAGFTSSGTSVRAVSIGSATWIISGSVSSWTVSGSNLSITGTGTISLTSASAKQFSGGGLSYSGITLNQGGAGALTITGNNTFKDITNTYSATGATSIALGATTQTLTSPWTATGEAGRVLTVSGTSAASPATLRFTGAGTAANVDYLAINNVRAYDLVDEWYAGANSTNGGSLGWYFVAAGGTVYAVTITETGTGTDAITAKVTLLGTISETGTGTDSISSSFLFLGAVSESATVTDSNFAKFQPKANITETATGSDVESAILSAISLIAETATGSDTDLARLVAGATLTETATGTDTDAAALTVGPTITETATGSDTETARYIAHPVISETATGSDADVAKLIVRPAIIEAATGSDTDSAKLTANSNLSETATGSDTDSAKLTAQSVIAELATITDAASARATLLAAVIEAATITDLPSSIKGLFVYILESVTATDSINAPGSTYNPSLSESATATDNIVALTVFVAQIVEATTAADVVAAFKSYFSAVLETASGADLVAAQFTAKSIIAESATGSDTETPQLIMRPSVSETATVSDADVGRIVFPGNIAELATAADTDSAQYTTRPNIAETATGTDAPSARATFRSSLIESSTVQDIVQAYLTAVGVITELATGADQVSALRALAVAISETASTTDTVAAKAIFQGILQELATAQDAVNAPGSTYSAPIVELATLLDAVLARATFPVSLNETATGTEAVQATFIPYARIVETATITDAASALAIFAARTVESAYITDQVSPPGSIYNPVVLAVAQLLDQVSPPGSIYNAPVLESATISDSLIGGFLWIDVNDDQVANWGDINNVQTTTWLAVDDSQTTNWQNVNNTQTSGWTDVDDTQTPGWNPVLP
jgi:hypothetical protein